MPLKNVYQVKSPVAQEEPSLWDRIGKLPGVIGTGIRAVSGVASAEGGPTGALISGGGEAAAELASGEAFRPSTLDPNSTFGKLQSYLAPSAEDAPWKAQLKGFAQGALSPAGRIATEAGLGAVPFGSVLKEGRPLASAARGALYAGVGETGREFTQGRDIDPGAIGTSAALGGAITGGLAKLLGTPAAKTTAPDFIVEPTSRGIVQEKGKFKTELPPRPIPATATAPIAAQEKTSAEKFADFMGRQRQSREIPYSYEYAGGPAAKSAAKEAVEAARARKVESKLAAQKEAANRIEAAREEAGVVARPPSFSESISAPAPEGGTQRMSVSYAKPPEEEVGELGEALGVPPTTRSGGGRIISRNVKVPEDWQPPYGTASTPRVPEPIVPPPSTPAEQLAPKPVEPSQGMVAPPSEEIAPPSLPEPQTARALTPNQQARQGSFEELLAKLKGEPPAEPSAPSNVIQARFNPVEPANPMTPESIAAAKTAGEAQRTAEGMPEGIGPKGGSPTYPVPSPTMPTAPDEANAELDKLGTAYRALPPGPERRAIGKQMAEIRDFFTPGKMMRESWRGAPSAEVPVAPAVTKIPEAPATPIEPAVAPGLAQTSKAREAALAARKAQQAETVPPELGATPPKQAKKFEALFNKLKAERSGPGSEKGAIDPALLAKLGMGLGGAAVGAAVDPFDNRLESALVGGAAGVGATYLPQLLSQIGAAPQALHNLAEKIKTPEGITEAAGNIWHTLPQIQRFNYLMDAKGLPANALFGPYGSATFAALEHALSGDPRGVEALKLLSNPNNFAQELRSSFEEARELINRSESRWSETGPVNDFERLMAVPGTAMTAGDVAARRILERVGFSEEEARRITLTSEPELTPFKRVANFSKGSPFLQTLLPFARTPANIGEQGMERFPGLGFLVQAQRENPDPIKQQAIQQLISLGVGGASYEMGANLDPETAKTAKRYVSNFGGQYSLPASIGFAAGQSVQRGQPAISPSTIGSAVDVLPLPTIQPIQEWIKFISGNGPLPHGAIPAVISDMIKPAAPALPQRLPRLRRLQ